MNTKQCHCCQGTGTEIDSKALGQKLRSDRIAAGKSQREVASFMSVSEPYLSDLERGHRRWREELIQKYTQAIKT